MQARIYCGLSGLLVFAGIHCTDLGPLPQKSEESSSSEVSVREDPGTSTSAANSGGKLATFAGANSTSTPDAGAATTAAPPSVIGSAMAMAGSSSSATNAAGASSSPDVREPAAGAGNTSAADAGSGMAPGSALDAGAGDAGRASDAGSASSSTPSQSAAVCLRDVTGFESLGPFSVQTSTSGSIKFWVPMVGVGCRVPILHFSNGSNEKCATYQMLLERFASHGFLTACFEAANTGDGTQALMAFEAALAKYPDLVDGKLGSMGQNQGGQATFTSLKLAEEKWGARMSYAGLAIEPTSGFGQQPTGGTWQEVYAKVQSPVCMFSGTADMLVSESWVQQAFDALSPTTEAYWYSAVGATHVPPPIDAISRIGIPWFRWKLLGDAQACEDFKNLPSTDAWDSRKEHNAKTCP